MTIETAESLYNLGRAHALSGNHLYAKALDYAIEQALPDPDDFAFNGTFSLSTYYLLSLGIELYLKAAYVASGGNSDERHLRSAIGHDLGKALARAGEMGFVSQAPRLEGIISVLDQPYREHFFRYSHPETFGLPIVPEIVQATEVLDVEVRASLDAMIIAQT